MSFKFIKEIDTENQFSIAKIEMEIPNSDITLDELVESFESFVRGCGYHLNNRRIIVEDLDE